MITQEQAQRALTATLALPLVAIDGSLMPAGNAVTLVWLRSFLIIKRQEGGTLRHQYRVFGFNMQAKYVEGVATEAQLENIVYLSADFPQLRK